ncbi:hypothetical protein JZ751_009914 [Albula glossodonta]|uniref:Uncharacterized protein n=1 Tax=Albula glossodonta TaxID=121402 RepID=A0A8T2P9N5_9TELE|nr:hypothetical protein JZ751_009914 [Albula glossodonta]
MNVTLPEQRGRAQIKKDEELRETVTGLNRAVQNCRSVGLFHADSVQSQKYMQLTLEREAAQGHKALTMLCFLLVDGSKEGVHLLDLQLCLDDSILISAHLGSSHVYVVFELPDDQLLFNCLVCKHHQHTEEEKN